MNKNITLLILAGGMGSRFGGLKQIEPVGPNGEFIIDYSIYDAIKAGFNRIVFLIKEENYKVFKETIGKRIEDKINVLYVFQKNDNINKYKDILNKRKKPLGTAHAILCAKEYVNEPFAIINADDFYGKDAFIKAYEYLKNVNIDENNYGMIGYKAVNTLTDNGSVKRGICEVDKNNYLLKIIESKVEKRNNYIEATPLNSEKAFRVNENAIVSMNFLLFTPTIFKYIEDNLESFLESNKDDLMNCEYLIPDVLENLISLNIVNTKVISTNAVWYGVTYKEDKPSVVNAINKLISNNIYSKNLWD